jgi:outer membrane protein assembly factor BamB
MNRLSLIAAAVLITAAAVNAADDEWTRFRGPSGTGISAATTIPVKWTDADYNWKVELPGTGHSSPVVCGNRVYVTSADDETARRTVLCLSTADGHTLWRRDYESKTYPQNNANSYATATPACDAAGVVVTWTTPAEVVLVALDPDGKEVWRRGLGPFTAVHGSGTSPVVYGDKVILANDQEDLNRMPAPRNAKAGEQRAVGKSFLVALDRKTGEIRWQTDRRTGLAAYSTPCVYQAGGGRPELIFTSTAHGITAIDPDTGKVNWEMADLFKDRCSASPVCAPGLVIAGYGYGTNGTQYVAVRPGSKEKGVEPSLAYKIEKPVPLVPTPLVKDGRLFFWFDNGTVACLKAETGEQIWRDRVPDEAFYGSPVCVNDRLYCISRTGDVIVLAAGDKFELLAKVPLGEKSFATPAVSGGVMYLRTLSHLFSLGGKKP